MSDVPMTPEAFVARRRKPASAIKQLTQLELTEVSMVDMPANPGARHLFFKSLAEIAKAEPVTMTPAEIEALAAAEVAKAVAMIGARMDRAEAIAARVAGGTAQGSAAIRPSGRTNATKGEALAEAVRLAKAAEEQPPAYWRTALRLLGELLAPDASPSEQEHAALASPDGQILLRALAGDKRP
jgi:hypothetical protein